MVGHEDVLRVLQGIDDPEMPISIVDLGLVNDLAIDGERVAIEILPTFVGCPALPMIRDEIRKKVGALDGVGEVDVTFTHDPAWTVDRITERGRDSLRTHGITVPGVKGTAEHETCPFCTSTDTRLDSPFGTTRCRQIYYCESCKNQFEPMKRV